MSEFLQQLLNGIAWGSIYALIALGYTMVYGVLRFINFAHGDVYMVGAMVGFYTARLISPETPILRFGLVLGSAMMVCAVLGGLIEAIAYRPLRKAPRLSVLITAIGISLFLEYGGQLIFGPDPKFFPTLIPQTSVLAWNGIIIGNLQLLIVTVSILLMFGLWFFVMKTRMGKAMRAVSYSYTASQLVGINVNSVVTTTFLMGSALAGAAGVLVGVFTPRIDPLMGILFGLKAFVAAVLGGIGSIPGALLGGYLLGVSETFVTAYISSTYRDALAFGILILILILKPAGILGKAVKEKV